MDPIVNVPGASLLTLTLFLIWFEVRARARAWACDRAHARARARARARDPGSGLPPSPYAPPPRYSRTLASSEASLRGR